MRKKKAEEKKTVMLCGTLLCPITIGKPALFASEGNFYRTDDETFRQACDIFGEDKLISAGVPYITFVYEDAQDVQGLVEKAEALAEDGNIDLDWFNDDFAAVLANDEYTKVESDDSVARYLRL